MINKRSWRRNLIIALFSLSSVRNSFSQEFSRVIPPSPNASSLGVFGEIPVGFYTGTPEISIPIYEIKCGTLSLPITLSYDATGIRVAQDASWVGLGWSLAAGGIVTRSIRGKDDFQGYYISEKLPACNIYNEYFREIDIDFYPENAVDSTSIHDGQYFRDMKGGAIDGEPDIFSYNFGNYSGKFVIDKEDNGSGVFLAKRNNLDIIFNENGTGFTITTPDGNKYIFGTTEWVISRYNNTTISDPSIVVGVNGLDKGYLQAPSTWYLDKIVSPNRDTIEFTYSTRESLSLTNKNEKSFNGLYTQNSAPLNYSDVSVSREHFNDVYVSKITFKNGWIDFETNDREDIEPVNYASKPQKLSKIKINNFSGLVKEVDLGHSYFNQQDTAFSLLRLKLDYVQVGDSTYRYSFTYLDPDNLPNKFSRQADMWGFYTYPFSNEGPEGTFLPEVTVQDPNNISHYLTFTGVTELDQKTDTTGEFSKKGILTSITYPTKGRTDFEYEVHGFRNGPSISSTVLHNAILDYTDPDPENYIIEPIDTFTLAFSTVVHFNSSTDYNFDESNVGYLKNAEGAYLFVFDNQYNIGTTMLLPAGVYTVEAKYIANHRTEVQGTYDITISNFTKGNGIRIKSITNYADSNTISGKKSFIYSTTGDENDPFSSGLLLKTIKNYYVKPIYYNDDAIYVGGIYLVRTSSSIIPSGFYSQPNVVGYDKVCVKDGLNDDNGSTIYNFYNQEYDNQDLYPEIPEMFDSRNGQLLSVEIRDSVNSLIKKIEYEYERKENYSVKGVKVYKAPFDNTETFSYAQDVHYYDNYSEWWVQSSTIETNYFSGNSGVMIDTVKYNYNDSLHKQVTSTEITGSDHTKRITYYKYPYDFVSQQPYTDMVNTRHIWSPVIMDSVYKTPGNIFLHSSKTNYKNWGDSIYAPQTLVTKTLNNAAETRIHYYSYDNKGNIISGAKENDVKKSYTWDYNLSYPIAEAINADSASISATSFEADGKGGWTFSGSTTTHPTAPTGSKGYSLAGGNITRSGLNTSTTYIITYWKRDSASTVTVNSGSGTLLVTKNGWKLYSHELTGTTTFTISGTAYIDELRLYPKGALMTTYTYQPLIGLTSQCDVNDRIIYYEYDSFGRLKLIKDEDGRILKRIDYKYQATNQQ